MKKILHHSITINILLIISCATIVIGLSMIHEAIPIILAGIFGISIYLDLNKEKKKLSRKKSSVNSPTPT